MPDAQGYEVLSRYSGVRHELFHHPCEQYVANSQAARAAHLEDCSVSHRLPSMESWDDNQHWLLDGGGLAEILSDNDGDALQATLDVFELTGGRWMPSASMLESIARRQGYTAS